MQDNATLSADFDGKLTPVQERAIVAYCYRPDVPRVVEDRRKKRNSDSTYKTRIIKYEIPKDESVRLDCPPANLS